MQEYPSALIGFTGFVGSNILSQKNFSKLYNSKNIDEIRDKSFDLVVCAGAPGTKWLANKEPEKDRQTIESLINNLKTFKAKKFVLISTIDVYSPVNGVNEDSPIHKELLTSYGKNRLFLEEFVEKNFDHAIIRLPTIFGKNLKKNVIFDLINKHNILIHPESALQFYCLDNIYSDIEKVLKNNIKIINFATEPVKLDLLAREIFYYNITNTALPLANYDMRSKYSKLWGKDSGYLYSKNEILKELRQYVKNLNK